MLKHDSAIPLYQQIENDIKEKIASGEYQAGQMLPSENKYCEMYKVSRVTVRNAITDLVDEGILIRKHGKGTFVENQKIQNNLIKFQGFTSTCRENNIKMQKNPIKFTRLLNKLLMKVIRISTKLIRDDIINKGIGKILGVLNSKRVSQLYDAVCMFLSTGAFIAGVLDIVTDKHFDGVIRI